MVPPVLHEISNANVSVIFFKMIFNVTPSLEGKECVTKLKECIFVGRYQQNSL